MRHGGSLPPPAPSTESVPAISSPPSNGAGFKAKDAFVCAHARLLSNGTSYLDCGRPCERHLVSLRDSRVGKEHPVVVDVGCRNTVFSAEANSVWWR